jgi:diguanylate cyclase (GGDEF)-like protein
MGVLREAKQAASEGAPAPASARPALTRVDTLVDSYRRLADVFHDVLSEERLDSLLERIADTLGDLVPYDTFTIYQADEARRCLIPLMARDTWADEIMNDRPVIGQGITGWAVEHREPQLVNQAHLDPRVKVVPGTPPDEPEALITIPLVARDAIKGALNIYRLGGDARFTEEDFELAKRFGDAAALALDNAQVRESLELQAQTDSLTGLYNHRYFHERLRSELTRATRSHDSIGVLMLDIDDFKRVNDIHGHGTGDQVLVALADVLRGSIRLSDVVCRLGGEEFGIIMSSCDAGDAMGLAQRLLERMESESFEPAGSLTLSIGIAQGPDHATNPRELVAYAEAAMMTAKARGKNQGVLFDDGTRERPAGSLATRDVRSIAHLKMLQSLAGKLNRLNDVREIGATIVNELRMLVDYHSCRVYVADGEDLIPIAWRGDLGPYEDEGAEELQSKFGEGITGTAAERGQSLLIANALDVDFAVTIPGTDDIEESMIAVPLKYGARVIGVVTISKLGVGQFDDDDVRLLEVLGGHASVALENARLYEAERNEAARAKESLEIANALLEFSREVAAADGLDEVLGLLVDLTSKMLGAERTSVWLQQAETGDLVATAVCGRDDDAERRLLEVRFSPDVAHDLLSTNDPFVLEASQVAQIEGAPDMAGMSLALAPLHLDSDRVGCIAAAAPAGHFEPSGKRMRLLAGIAHQAKLAIQNASSFESLEDTFLSTVEALANALEANDEYTSSHARWITDMALEVGRELSLDAKTLKRLELGALFHDIGKIGIPASILAKPGPLTAEERAVIETHPELGERILAPISRLEDVRPIVRHCHERWDGAGYPDGKAAEDIPIEARVILVCDAFHAMTTDRPYRSRLPIEEALRRLEESAGSQFDPDVVEAFIRLAPQALEAHPV